MELRRLGVFHKAWTEYGTKCNACDPPFRHFLAGFIRGWKARSQKKESAKQASNKHLMQLLCSIQHDLNNNCVPYHKVRKKIIKQINAVLAQQQ